MSLKVNVNVVLEFAQDYPPPPPPFLLKSTLHFLFGFKIKVEHTYTLLCFPSK